MAAKAKFKTENEYKKITFDEVVDFLTEHGTKEEKAAFKKACYTNAKGETTTKLNWLNGKLWFCTNFAPELVPVKKEEKEPKGKRIENW